MILLGLGSNLPSSFGDRFKNIDLAISLVEKNDIKVIKIHPITIPFTQIDGD